MPQELASPQYEPGRPPFTIAHRDSRWKPVALAARACDTSRCRRGGRQGLVNSYLRHYTARLRHSQRLRYRLLRQLVVWAPLVVFMILVILVAGGMH